MSKLNTVAKSSLIITGVLILSKVMGFFRELIIAVSYGASSESDIFKIATTIPNVLFSCVAAALVTTFIPVFANLKNDKKEANKFFSNIFNLVLILCAVISFLGIVFAPVLVKLFASGWEGEAYSKTVFYTRLVMPSIVFLGLSGLYTGYLQSYGIFLQPAMTGIAADIVIITGIVFFSQYGIAAAIISVLIGAAAQIFIQRPFMKGYKYSFILDYRDTHIQRMIKLGMPVFISNVVGQLNLMIDRSFASHLIAGSISVIDYASKISTIINQVFIVSVVTVLYPMLTEKFLNKDKTEFRNLVIKTINLVLIMGIPLIIGMVVLSQPIVRVLLEHGKFDSYDALRTAICLAILAVGTLGYSLLDTISKIFFAARETMIPMINGFIIVALNIVLIFIFAPLMGVYGLALATTSSGIIMALVILIELRHKIEGLYLKKVLNIFLKCIASGGVMGAIVKVLFGGIGLILSSTSAIYAAVNVAACALIGIILYITLLKKLKVEEVDFIISIVKRRKTKK